MKELTHGIKFAGVWEAGALVKRVEVLHNKTKSAAPVCAHCPDSGHFSDVGAWGGPTWGLFRHKGVWWGAWVLQQVLS